MDVRVVNSYPSKVSPTPPHLTALPPTPKQKPQHRNIPRTHYQQTQRFRLSKRAYPKSVIFTRWTCSSMQESASVSVCFPKKSIP